ncbi:MAG TPA: hypothetical protein VF530_06185 [Planctomycetota bacterium]
MSLSASSPGPAGLAGGLAKPGGGTFLPDPHQSGKGAALHLVEASWGRLVDVHDLGGDGAPSPVPCFRDLVVNEGFQSIPGLVTLETHPVTQRTRLVLHAKRSSELFAQLLDQALQDLAPVVPKFDDGRSAPPFSLVARNACLVLRFDDLLLDDAVAELALAETVQVWTGYPPSVPFAARLRFDPNHGGLANGAFHSTRVLVDFAVSAAEATEHPVPLPVAATGLPASLEDLDSASASVRVPTRIDLGSGQFRVLTNLAKNTLDPAANGPVDLLRPTADVVRGFRAGRGSDPSNGFLMDLEPPRVLAGWAASVEQARPVDDGTLVVRLAFRTVCRAAPVRGDVLIVGGTALDVLRTGLAIAGGRYEVSVRPVTPVADPAALLGIGELLVGFSPARAARVGSACWLGFSPTYAGRAPVVVPEVQLGLRFSEPMEPTPDDYETLRIVRGAERDDVDPSRIVPAVAIVSGGADQVVLQPLLPLAHAAGASEPYHFRLLGGRDLAGNPVQHLGLFPAVDFFLDPAAASQRNGGLVLRFQDTDEVGPDGLPDVRGQFFHDLARGHLRGRPPAVTGYPVDRTNPVPGIMIPFPPGVQTPLVPLGSKMQAVWRYCDLGWNVRDETKYNLDVLGLSWAPRGGLVIADFYPLFEIRLAHSRFLPDEAIDNRFLTPLYRNSGLPGGPAPFADNVLMDPLSPQTVVHPRALGYTVRAADLFVASSGTVMLPYPLNRGPGPDLTYTWRDTAVLAKAGPNGAGIPLGVEASRAVDLEPMAGTIAPPGSVPSFGLPLLIEYRCFPTDVGLGLNPLDISLAINSSALPAFRAYSSGGINTAGQPVVVLPDSEDVPQGGFNPNSGPPGRPTMFSADNAFYIGQLDVVTRLSRAHTIWLDTQAVNPDFQPPMASPSAGELPAGTAVQLAFRGALGFSGAGTAPFDATRLDAYGELDQGSVTFLDGDASWKTFLSALDGARYVQARLTFVNHLPSGASPFLASLALAYETD